MKLMHNRKVNVILWKDERILRTAKQDTGCSCFDFKENIPIPYLQNDNRFYWKTGKVKCIPGGQRDIKFFKEPSFDFETTNLIKPRICP